MHHTDRLENSQLRSFWSKKSQHGYLLNFKIMMDIFLISMSNKAIWQINLREKEKKNANQNLIVIHFVPLGKKLTNWERKKNFFL